MTTGLVGMITGVGSMTAKLAFGAPPPELERVFCVGVCVGVWVGVVSVRR